MAEAQFLGPQEVHQLPSSPADHRIHYGNDPLQFGDLRLPKTLGRHPVILSFMGVAGSPNMEPSLRTFRTPPHFPRL